ncbi:SGNH/GDSL hydrolase family protein [Cryobacterium sp. PH31-O1]|uniref:SGNH/GDSL hydrolase family protein n=1 Tax=Cryobacterium sp. PH31-O1 TaxID=3046306 RepID=UPI0024B99BC5|nr:SGNH/GDSL hydrolase family protein [Cryobacterium sp. PH31-O1]MDJ0339505.1 SGNH/GDSL hydrolase family protein [Cryobacterium sp. PH31-O1]
MTNQRNVVSFLSRLGAVSVLTVGLVGGVATAPALAQRPAPPTVASALGYVALGDSFTAGQGAPPYVTDGTACLRSKRASYPTFAAFVSAYRLTSNRACSGASTADVPAQLLGVSPGTTLVTLTVGGIDAGSNIVLAACASDPTNVVCLGAIDNSVAQLGLLAPKLVGAYTAVATALPQAKIAVLSYPRQFKPGFSPLGDVLNRATDALNTVIAGSVAAMATPRIRFVDASQEFAGHGIGSRVAYFALDPLNPLAPANFHPNALGNSLGYTRALANDAVLRRP